MFRNDSSNSVICYHGPINIDLVSFFSNFLKQNLKTNAIVIGRMYRVMIELMQNVSYYSVDQFSSERSYGSGIGWFRIDEEKNSYTITSGNKILKEHGPVLEQNCNEINTLDEISLRELKRKTRRQANVRDIGAHIGLIQAGLITGNSLILEVKPIDKTYSFFTISVKVNKC